MPLSFNPNTPQASNTVASTQAPILQNFQSIDSAFDNTNTGGNFTQYATQNVAAALSGGTLPMDPVSIYHTVNGVGTLFNGHPIPYFANSTGDYPIIPDLIKRGANSDWSFKIGNIKISCGNATTDPGTKKVTVTFATPFTTIFAYSAQVNQASGSLGCTISVTDGLTGVTINSAVGNNAVYYIVIGV